MLRRLYIGNYKCHSNFSLEPGRLNLFMGKNGSAKSTVPQALSLIQRFAGSPEPLKDLLPDSSRSRWSKSPEQTFELTRPPSAPSSLHAACDEWRRLRAP